MSKQFGVGVNTGALVTQVVPDSPAGVAKVEPGDVILKLDGKPVRGTRSLQGIVEQLRLDGTYDLVVLRAGKEVALKITMKEMPKQFSLQQSRESSSPQHPEVETPKFDNWGLQLQSLTDAKAKEFGVSANSGVLIEEVKPDSPAAEAGLRKGMLVERVGPKTVRSPAEFEAAVKEMPHENGIPLLVRAGGAARWLVLELPVTTDHK